MLRHAKAIVDRGIASRGIEARGSADITRGNAAEFLDGLGTVTLLGNETRQSGTRPNHSGANEGFVHKAFRDDHMRERRDDGDIGPRPQGEDGNSAAMVRRTHQIRPARVDDDELCAFRKRFFIRDPKTGCASVGLQPMMRMTSASSTESKSWFPPTCESLAQSIAGRRMADSRASVDIIVTKTAADQL